MKSTFLLSLLIFTLACEEEEIVSGCTDPDSINFSADATLDDGSCMFLRDQYIGTYNITTDNCSREDFWDNLSVSIEATSDSGSEVLLKINGFTPATIPIELVAEVDENGINLSDDSTYRFAGGVGVTFLNIYDGTEYVGVTFSMSGQLKPNGDELNGRLAFSALSFEQDKIVSTLCDYTLSPS
ncbi:MAG: hypothetical protein AAGI23_14770 [Bacteroidota bacterium]